MPMIISQRCHYDIIISRVAVINNVKNVRLRHRHQTTPPFIYEVIYSKRHQQMMRHLWDVISETLLR